MQAGEKAKVTAFIGSKSGYVEITCIDVIVTIYANPQSVPTTGGTTTITAVVTETDGKPINGVIVIFFTDQGSLNPVYCPTNASGIAQTILTLPANNNNANVSAKCGSRLSNIITITRY